MNEREKRENGKRKTAGWKGFNRGLPMPSLLTSRALGFMTGQNDGQFKKK